MRLTWLCAIPLTLALYGSAAAQVNVLVEHDTSKDACKSFKMRVLMPANVSPKLRVENPAGFPDSGIVWNPCREEMVQLAGTSVIISPGQDNCSPPNCSVPVSTGAPVTIATVPDRLPAVPPSQWRRPPSWSRRVEQPTALGVKLPSVFEMMRRQR